uniref:Si:dkeyp-121d2.7 n=1 Tax=Cyprinus carpio TaxID=7962 RepID=A0A8C2E1L0_CYPCA
QESGLGSPSQETCGSEGVAFIGLDGLCSSQQAMSSSSHRADPAELQLPTAPANKEEESGGESGDMLHFCARCGSGFSSTSDLMKHSCPAAEERPYQCSVCGRAFGHAWSLKSHECIQTGEQPHHCELCGKRFTHSRSLERHQLVHTGERPHRCPQCGRSFSRLGNLERHQRIHTGERPYECGTCGKRFSRFKHLSTQITLFCYARLLITGCEILFVNKDIYKIFVVMRIVFFFFMLYSIYSMNSYCVEQYVTLLINPFQMHTIIASYTLFVNDKLMLKIAFIIS